MSTSKHGTAMAASPVQSLDDASDVEKTVEDLKEKGASGRLDEVAKAKAKANQTRGHDKADRKLDHKLDAADFKPKYREKWWMIWRPSDPPPLPRETLAEAPLIPLATANILEKLTFTWITPIMTLGYQRPLQPQDLWAIDEARQSGTLSSRLDESWERRCKAADEYNARLAAGEVKPGMIKNVEWSVKALKEGGPSHYQEKKAEYRARWAAVDGRKAASLAWALNDTIGWHFWLGGVFKVFGDTSQLMGPLVSKQIIQFAQERAAAQANGTPEPHIGRGVAMAIGLFLLTVTQSVSQHQFFWRSMTGGILARSALTASIYRRGVGLTPQSRVLHSNASLVNHVSTDVSRVDACAQWFHAVWTAPIQVTVCLIILLVQIGPSALAGFALFLVVIPFQERIMGYQFNVRQRSMKWTDQRAKIVQELLGGMRIIKYFTYENPFVKRIWFIRGQELKGIKNILVVRAANLAMAFTIPVLAAVLAFITYILTAHDFNPALIFTSLSLFNLLRQPLIFLPRGLSYISDAKSAVRRLTPLFHAPLRTPEDDLDIRPDQSEALIVENAEFTWEQATKPEDGAGGKNGKGGKGKKEKKKKIRIPKDAAPADANPDAQPFRLKDINMTIPRGQLTGIVGPVGSGKSSLLLGLIGEMRQLQGSVKFGGTVGYCAQTAWIQNATLRENVIFGRPWDEERYWRAIEDASLLPDLELLGDGDLTEIGEKGINLSGGQKQRVNIARALYFDADMIILDDPLSAVDAHVGKALFQDAILALKARGKTVVLVTHALHFLPQVDFVYTLIDGRIAEQGTYDDLMRAQGSFARLATEFGAGAEEEPEDEDAPSTSNITVKKVKEKSERLIARVAGTGKLEGRLMKTERRTIGSVSWKIYGAYLSCAKGWITGPLTVLFMVLMQSASVMNTYTLVWWEANSFNKPTGFYMGLYAGLGLGNCFFTFCLGASMGWMSYIASTHLHNDAVVRIFHAPMSFFDSTPLGRILGVFGKDIDTVDNQLADALRMMAIVLGNVFGAIIIVVILEPYFIIAVAGILCGYYYLANFYRSSARELKRLDANLRSLLYSHFSESLTGLATIRAYGETDRFLNDDKYFIDLENRALFLTVTNQRWLAIRLDALGACLAFCIAMLAVTGVAKVSPAQVGLVLTYTVSMTQMFSMLTRQSAEVENNMNSVERVVHYSRSDLIEQEAAYEKPDAKPPTAWPSGGGIEFEDVVMKYRPDLPSVLKGLNFSIRPGEKIGVVGRTGAGKSSIMVTLFRIVELTSGRISIDGIDISTLGLLDLRSKLSIIPQDPLLFSGTIRSNLDPFDLYDDAKLWDALKRSYLIEGAAELMLSNSEKKAGTEDQEEKVPVASGAVTPVSRYNLDTPIESEGANLSVGERSLLSLARALVKDSKVIVMDEATASVDLETDSKIQRTIHREFHDRTLLCIAHRLRTILPYDRIMVLDAGQIAEFDTPLNLFDQPEGIFRGMCEGSGITRDQIEKSGLQFDD